MHGRFSVKSDVYSFGVLVLEIISGKKNTAFYESNDGQYLLSHAWKKWREGAPLELLDPALTDSCIKDEVIRCIHVGLLSVQGDAHERPSMQSIVVMLSSASMTMPSPHEPALSSHSTETDSNMHTTELQSSNQSTTKSATFSVNEASITEVYPR